MDAPRAFRALGTAVLLLLLALGCPVNCVLAVDGATGEEIETCVWDTSLSDGSAPSEQPMIEIETVDVASSELSELLERIQAPSVNSKVRVGRKLGLTGEIKDQGHEDQLSRSSIVTLLQEEIDELSDEDLAMVLIVVCCVLCVAALLSIALWSLGRYLWLGYRRQRLLQWLLDADDPEHMRKRLEKTAMRDPLVYQVGVVRQTHLIFIRRAKDMCDMAGKIELDEGRCRLLGLPKGKGQSSQRRCSLLQVVRELEQVRCFGERMQTELKALSDLMETWEGFQSMMSIHAIWVRSIERELVRMQHVVLCVADLLGRKIDRGEPLARECLEELLEGMSDAELSDTSAKDKQGGSSSEFQFLAKLFDELRQQEQIREELQRALTTCKEESVRLHIRVDRRAIEAESDESCRQLTATSEHVEASLTVESHARSSTMEWETRWTERLETMVDQAELLEMTHVQEVEHAQQRLEEIRRQRLCRNVTSPNGTHAMASIQELTNGFVALGADHKDAVLKAGEIYANRSNAMLLTHTLRAAFDDIRRRDLVKMEERRRRDRAKCQERRERMLAKFHFKRQLLAERIEMMKKMEQDREEAKARALREAAAVEMRKKTRDARRRWVWLITKVDLCLVCLVLLGFLTEGLFRYQLLKPVCFGGDNVSGSSFAWAWFSYDALSVFGCHIAYGLKISLCAIACALCMWVASALRVLRYLLPVATTIILYQLRKDWINMVLRLPLVLFIVVFNQGALHVLHVLDGSIQSASTASSSPPLGGRAHRRIQFFAYVVFPCISFVLSVLVGTVVACDAPSECMGSALNMAREGSSLLVRSLREAYRL